MKVNGKHTRSIWTEGEDAFGIIDQTRLPHEFVTLTLRTAAAAAHAIKSMQTRGAPLIGAVADARRALEPAAREARRIGLAGSRADRRRGCGDERGDWQKRPQDHPR